MARQRPLGHALGNDLLGQGVLRVEHAQLDQQALAQVARANAQRIELLHHGQRFLDVFHRVVAVLGDLLERDGQVAVFIEIADDDLGDFAHRLVANGHAQLPVRCSVRPCGEEMNFSKEGFSMTSCSPRPSSLPLSRY